MCVCPVSSVWLSDVHHESGLKINSGCGHLYNADLHNSTNYIQSANVYITYWIIYEHRQVKVTPPVKPLCHYIILNIVCAV